jgi:HEAT repeat protein
MIRHRLTTLLVVLITVVIAAPTLARSKKPKTKATQATLDPDLANELYAVLERATRSADMETRSLAVLNLARVRPETVKDYVIDALKDPQWIVRYAAIKALIGLNNPAYRESLGQAIANSVLYEKPERSPLNLVLSLPTDEAVQLLEEALTKVEDVRDIILSEIFKEDSPLARQFYTGLNKVPVVQTWVMNNLRIFKNPEMYPLLVKTVPELQKAEKLKVFTFLEKLETSYDVSFLRPYLKDTDDQVREGAAFILATRGDTTAVEMMLIMCDENDIQRQLRCLQAVRGVPNHPPVLERAKLFLYGDPAPEVLYAVYDIFTLAKDDSIYDRMLQRLESTNLGHRAAAVYFIGRLMGNRALPQLHELLRDGSGIIRMRATQALGELRQAESVPYLADALRNDSDNAVRKEIVRSLGMIGDKSIVPIVSFLIFDPTVRDESIDALTLVNHRDAISTLRNVLQTQFTKEHRVKALRAIIKISPAESFDTFKTCLGWIPEGFLGSMAKELKGEFLSYLKAAMESINPRVRTEAVLAFRYMEPDLEKKVLEKVLFSAKDTELRVTILKRLTELRGETSLDLIKAFFKDENRNLRLAAIDLAATFALPDSEETKALRGMLLDPDEAYRAAAAVSLLNIYTRTPTPKKGK